MREQTHKILKTLFIYMLVISMMLSSLVGSWDVMAEEKPLQKPTLDPVSIGAKVVSGKGLIKSGQRKAKKAVCNIIVTVKDASDVEKETKTFTINYTEKDPKGNAWSVTLDNPVEAGYKVYAKQELVGTEKEISGEVFVVVQKLFSAEYTKEDNTLKITMPEIEVWSEDIDVLEDDAIEDIVNAFKTENNKLPDVRENNFEGNLYKPKDDKDKTKAIDVAGNGKSIKVTFSDKSTLTLDISGKVTVNQITEESNSPDIDKIKVVDGKITGKISGGEENKKDQFKRARVTIVKFIEGKPTSFCTDQGCSYDKNSAKELATVDVNPDTGEFEYTIQDTPIFQTLEYGKDIGVVVKEYRKKNNCSTTTPELVIPNVGVRDPKKLTKEEKKTIEEAIRKANTTENGTSKLPDWTVNNIPSYIEFDKDGNIKIINPANVDGDWTENYTKFVPKRNDDGSIKLKKDQKPEKTVEPKEVLTNLAPNQPTVSYKKETGEITVTPDKADTDAKTIKVTYKDPEGNTKTETATKGEDGKWKVVPPEGGESKIKVDENTGIVIIKDSDIQNKTNVSATVTDEGGIAANDTDKKTSDNKSEQIKIYPKKPVITVDGTTGDVTITPIDKDNDKVAKKMDITYTPAGKDETKTVTVERDGEGKLKLPEGTDFKVSEDGKSITITNDKIKSKTNITAKTNDGDTTEKLESEVETKNVPDKTAPQPPKVEIDTGDGTAHITPPTDPDVKTIEVKYPGADGNEKKFTATKTDTGWEISGDSGVNFEMSGYISIPYDKLKKADTITATAKDQDGNVSKQGTDISLPPAPTAKESEGVITVTPPENTPAVNGMEITYTPDGSEETKTFKVVKDNDDKWKIDGDTPDGVTVNENGTVTIANGTAKEKTKVTAISSIDTNKKSLEKGEATVTESKAPEAPTVKVQDNGSVTITPKNKGETTVTVTYKDKDGNDKTATATKGKNGKWTVVGTNGEEINEDSGVITIPSGNTNPGDRVKATASKGSKTSEEGKDLTKPAPPTVTPEQESGNVTITPPTKGNVDGMIIKYKKSDGTDGTIKVKKGDGGTWTFEGENPDTEGVEVNGQSGVVSIKKGHAKEKTPVTADSTIETLQTPDKNQGEQPALVPDKTAPNPPTVKVEDNGNVTITPPTDEDTTKVTVTYKDKDGNEKTAIATKGDDGWKMGKAENGENVDSNGVITLAKGSYKTEQPVTAYGNDNVDNKSTDDSKIPVEVTFDVNGGTKTIDGSILAKGGNFVLPAIFESEYYPLNKEFAGWQIDDETELKQANASITVSKNTKIKAVWKDIEYKVTFNGNTGTGSMDEKLVKKGNEYELPANGFTAPEGKEFDGWMVGTEKKAVGDKITINADTEVKAIWKNISPNPNPEPQPGPGPEPQPEPTPDPGQPQTIKAPKVTVDTATGDLIITPPAGENVKSVTVNYKDPSDADKTATVEKSSDKWSLTAEATNGENADKDTGVITIPKGKYKLGAAVKAYANNKSDQKSGEVEATPLEVSFDVNGGTKRVESSIALKDQYYVLPAIYELPEYMYTAPEGKEFAGWEVDGETKPAKTSIKITENTVLKAVWKDKGQDSNSKPNQPVPQVDSYNPWWPIWFGSSEVKPATPVAPVKPAVEMERGIHRKYLYGYKDHTVRPEGLITRAEAAALIARLAELDMSNNMKPNFKDTKSAWYNTAINAVVAKNLMFADKDGDFRPNEPITRGEFARALFFIDKKNNAVAPFADVKGHVYEEAINQAYGNDRIKGYPDGTFKPDATITRAEAATILNNYADRNVTFKGMVEVHKDVVKFTDINESHWAYYEIMEAANTHEYQREKGTIPETWLEIKDK